MTEHPFAVDQLHDTLAINDLNHRKNINVTVLDWTNPYDVFFSKHKMCLLACLDWHPMILFMRHGMSLWRLILYG